MPEPTPKELVERLRSQHTALAGWVEVAERAHQVVETSHQVQITALTNLLEDCRRTLGELERRLP
jgi:hypothetical protein